MKIELTIPGPASSGPADDEKNKTGRRSLEPSVANGKAGKRNWKGPEITEILFSKTDRPCNLRLRS